MMRIHNPINKSAITKWIIYIINNKEVKLIENLVILQKKKLSDISRNNIMLMWSLKNKPFCYGNHNNINLRL